MAATGRAPFVADMPPALVGRERELVTLRAALASALAGRGGLVLIAGEAGIGKTALAGALLTEATGQGALVLVGRCYDLSETPSYGPWREMFGRYQPSGDLPPPPPPLARRGTPGDVTSQEALFDTVVEFFAALTARQPTLLLLEDLHWADPASLDLLRFLARAANAGPLLLIATYRADELVRRHPLVPLLPVMVREGPAVCLALRHLDPDAIRALVMDRYRLPEADVPRLVTYLSGRSEGNPFFIVELLHALEEAGALQATDSGWQLGALLNAGVPRILRGVIDGRVARLGDDAQALLALAAILGQEVSLEVWGAVAGVDEETLLRAVDHAARARLLEPTPDGAGVRFSHALIREAVYEAISPARRRAQHRRAAEVLAAPRADPDPDAVADHFERAGDARAAAWLVRAGERAQRAYAWLTAAARYETALASLDARGADPAERGWLHYRLAMLRRYTANTRGAAHLAAAAQCAADAADRMLAAHVQYYRGLLDCFAGNVRAGLPEIEAGLAALEALPEGVRSPHAPPEALMDASTGRGVLVSWLAQVGRFAAVCALGEALVARHDPHGTDGQTPPALMPAYHGLGLAYAHRGDDAGARRAFARSHAINRATGHGQMLGQGLVLELFFAALPYQPELRAARRALADEAERAWARAQDVRADVPARFAQMPLLILEGRWGEAYPLAVAAHTAGANNMAHKPYDAVALGPLAYARGEAALVWSLVREWLPEGPGTAPGTTVYYVVGLQRIAATLALDAGDLPAARAWLEAHDRWLTWSGATLGRSEGQLLWARYHRHAGDPAQARTHAERALAHASGPRQPLALLAAQRLLGELDTETKRYEEAARRLAAALALADACAAVYERALTLLALADLRAVSDARAEAQERLKEARAICAPLGAVLALARADAIAARLAAMDEPPAIFPGRLSAREVDVLRLVATGLTDAEVGRRLSLSRRTVGRHLTSIYDKLGVSTRTAASRFAIEHRIG